MSSSARQRHRLTHDSDLRLRLAEEHDDIAPLACRHAAESMDMQAPSATLDAAMAKCHATEAGCNIADDAMQVGTPPVT